jgi:hypothetical protein
MNALCLDSGGIVARAAVPESRSVTTGTFYLDHVLTAVNHYPTITKNLNSGMRRINLLHDNASALRSALVQAYLKEQRIEVLLHVAYSPDLSPFGFWLNSYIKSCL